MKAGELILLLIAGIWATGKALEVRDGDPQDLAYFARGKHLLESVVHMVPPEGEGAGPRSPDPVSYQDLASRGLKAAA